MGRPSGSKNWRNSKAGGYRKGSGRPPKHPTPKVRDRSSFFKNHFKSDNVCDEIKEDQKTETSTTSKTSDARQENIATEWKNECIKNLQMVFSTENDTNNGIFCEEVWEDDDVDFYGDSGDEDEETFDDQLGRNERESNIEHRTHDNKKSQKTDEKNSAHGGYLPPVGSSLHTYLLMMKDVIKESAKKKLPGWYKFWYPPVSDPVQQCSTHPESWYTSNTWVFSWLPFYQFEAHGVTLHNKYRCKTCNCCSTLTGNGYLWRLMF